MENRYQSILPKFKEADWKIEVIVAASDNTKVFKPVVRMKLHMDEEHPPINVGPTMEFVIFL